MQPENIGRYKIIAELGRGAMGQVYLAHDPEIDRKVAIKTVQIFSALPEQERAESRERFLREARSAGRLLHPGIVTLFDVGEADGSLYLAMEYVEGKTLDHVCRPERLLPVPLALELVARAAESLAYAHENGIVHRDIKPANLIRVGETGVKITDFGLAKPSEGQLTHDGALLGTPSYMSPEQIRGEPLDGRSDLFSLGVVLFELLTGERPFPGDSVSSIIYRIVNEEPRDVAKVTDRVPAALGGVLARALAKERDSRFADGTSFAAALRQAGSGLDVVLPEAPSEEAEIPAAERARPARSSAIPWVLAITIILAGFGVAGWIFREDLGLVSDEPPPVVWLEARVRAEPAEARIDLDGAPLDPELAGLVRFRPDQPGARLTATHECRTAERELLPTDADGEVVLVLDPVRLEWSLDPGVAGATLSLNDEAPVEGPHDLTLDLCRENRIQVAAEGHYPLDLVIPSEATPLQARTLLASVELREIPRGTLRLPESGTRLVFYIDGQRVEDGLKELELPEGEHLLRAKNETLWIDVRLPVSVAGGETIAAELKLPPMATLVVQAFPANCKVFLRRPGGSWKYVDDTPARRRIAAGKYDVRVKLNPTGETREQTVVLAPGDNPPVRVAFGRNS